MNLKIYRPLLTNRLTQHFGENKACQYPNGKIVSKKSNICPAGSVDFYKAMGMKGHSGQDWAAWHGEPIYHAATFDGKMKIEKDFQGGIGVDVISLEPVQIGDYTGHVKCRYWHLKAPIGHDGKIVKLGEVIGLADNTGASSGDHLHFGVKKCDENGVSVEKGNGYNGAFNHEPYMDMETDAKEAAHFLNQKPVITDEEKREMIGHLSMARRILLYILELRRL